MHRSRPSDTDSAKHLTDAPAPIPCFSNRQSARSEARPIDRHSSASFSPISGALLHPFPKLHPKASSIRHSGPLSNNKSALSSVTLPHLFHRLSRCLASFPTYSRQFPTLPHTAPTPSGRPVLWLFRTPTPHIRTLRLLRSSNPSVPHPHCPPEPYVSSPCTA